MNDPLYFSGVLLIKCRLMRFNDQFEFVGSNDQFYLIAGNVQ